MSARLHAVSDDTRPAVEVHALRNAYHGGVEAVRGIDFQVAPVRCSGYSARTAPASPPPSGC